MAVRQLRYEGDEALRWKCKEVKMVDDKIRLLLNDMMDTLHEYPNGAALAANQVGIMKRLVVIDYEDVCLKLVNPKIIGTSGTQECIEGCLSFPDQFGQTIRPQKVTIQAQDENGQDLLLEAEGEMAKCFCHELDHLDGQTFTTKIIGDLIHCSSNEEQ